MRLLKFWLWMAFTSLFCWNFALAEEVSSTPPDIYAKQLAGLITSRNEILEAAKTPPADKGAAGRMLIDERVHYLSADGRRFIVRQVAYQTISDSGVESNSTDLFSFRKKDQKFYFVFGETIQLDGTAQIVKPDAIIVQSPQRNAQYSEYDDESEVRVIYPSVKPGAITHAIIAIEETRTQMSGEYTYVLVRSSSWAVAKQRFVLDLPDELRKRLKIDATGPLAPTLAEEKEANGRSRLTWTRQNLPAETVETYPAPEDQSGSAIHLTTVAGWEDVDKWYCGLLQGRDLVNAAMKAKADEWTAKSSGQDDIIRVLLAHAASDVRYTGLEFGEADYQPHDCNEVWSNQYGDCKDKANLLATWLRYKGIPAKLVLLNAEHAGLIDRRSPDYGAFDHMIVAIPQKDGTYLFCDPTITYAKPGMLSPMDSDREVMVMSEPGKVDWVRTPAQDAGNLTYHFDAKQNAAGELSGWMIFTSSGYYAASEADIFQKLTADQARDRMEDLVQDFYKGAKVVDVARPSTVSDSDTYVVKAYFHIPGNSTLSADRQPLLGPNANSVLPDLGSSSQRETSYFTNRDKITVSLDLTLPPGYAPGDLPKPYKTSLASSDLQGQWQSTATTCHFEVTLAQTQSLLQPDKFTGYYNAIQSLSAWLAQPVLLLKGATVASAPPVDATTNNLDFPMMPSGDGQLNLVDEKYPISADHAVRRAALEKTLAYFPQDKAIAFRTKIRLAIIDWNENKNKEALDQITALLATYKSDVDANILSWAEDTEASVLQDLGRNDDALPIFTRIAKDTSLDDGRRADCALSAAQILQKKSPADAIAVLELALPLKNDDEEDIYTLLARLMLQANKGDGLKQHFQQLLQADGVNGQKVLQAVVTNSDAWTQPPDVSSRPALLQLVADVVPQPGPDLQKALDASKGNLAVGGACLKIQSDLKAALAAKPLSDWYHPITDGFLKKIEDFDAAYKKASSDNNPDLCTQITVQILVDFPPAADFPDRLWRAAAEAEWKEKGETPPQDPVLVELLALLNQLPESSDNYFEGKFILGRHLARVGDLTGERNLYLGMIKDPQITDMFLPYTLKHLGANYEGIPDYAKALDTYKDMERLAPKYNGVGDGLLRAVFINLQQGNPKEALRIIQVLAGIDEAMLKKCQDYSQIKEFIELNRSGKAGAYWTQAATWWPQWQSLAQGVGLVVSDQTVIVPDISDLLEYGKQLGSDIRGNDSGTYFKDYARIASAARWLPSMAFEMAGLAQSSVQMAPPKASDLRQLIIAQLEAAEVAGEEKDARQRHLMLAANYVDAGQTDKAMALITAFVAAPNVDDEVTLAMHRVWGFAALATHKDYDAPIKALEADLQNPGGAQRISSVNVLADLYVAENKSDDAQALVNRELDDPKNKDAAGFSELVERSHRIVGGSAFSKQVAAWLKANKPGWYDFAQPTDLNDPRVANLDGVLKSSHPPFNDIEMTKLELLVAQSDSQALDARQAAFNHAVGNLLDMASTKAEARQIIHSVIDGTLFDESVRAYWLWLGIFDAVEHRQVEDFTQWCADPLTAHFNPAQKEFLPLGKEFLALDPTSSPALMAFAKHLVQAPMDPVRLDLIRQVRRSLLRLGDIQNCKTLADGIPSWTIPPEANVTTESLQLDFAREMDRFKGAGSLGDDMAKFVLAHYPQTPSQPPAEYSALRNLDPLPTLGKETTLQECLYLIKTGQYDRSTFTMWSNFLRSLPDDANSAQLESDLIAMALKQAANDQQRSEVVNLAADSIDTDNPKKWVALQQSFTSYQQPSDPLTFSTIQTAEARVAVRTGKAIDLASAFSGAHEPNLEMEGTYMQLQHALAQQDHEALSRLINNMDSNQLLLPGFLRFTLPALDLLQMKTEAGLARQAAKKELNRAILISWATGNPGEVGLALRLAETLDKPDALPLAWVQEMSEKVADPITRWHVALVNAKLHKDWPNVYKSSDQIIQAYPTVYDFYWDKGMSLYQMGRKDEAVAPLTTFTTYCKDQVEYSDAVTLLKGLGKTSP